MQPLAADGIVLCRSWRASDAQRPVKDGRQLRRAVNSFFYRAASDSAVWLKLLVISGAARHHLCRFVS
jgi:hypothetical protein